VPGCSVEESFAGRPVVQREIFDKILSHLRRIGPVHVDAVLVGVFLKNERKFAEVRPMATALSVWLLLPIEIEDPRIQKRGRISEERIAYFLKLRAVKDVDAEVRRWLSLAYRAAAYRPLRPGPYQRRTDGRKGLLG
jgi:hypothetical protein